MKKFFYVPALVLLIVLLASCGSAGDNKAAFESDMAPASQAQKTAVDSNGTFDQTVEVQERKIIRTVRISAQTKSFDEFIAAMEDKVEALGGYIEASDMQGNGYDEKGSHRSASFTLRIPAKQDADMTDFLASNANVTQRSVSTEDATLQYVDIESRLSALQSEKTSLEKMMEEATGVDQIISIRSRLTEVIYEMESYQSQLRTFDNLVDYTTIYVSVSEVEVLTQTQEKKSLWQEIGDNLVYGFQSVWYFLQRLFVVLISALPYLLLIALPGVVVWIVLLICLKKKKKKK